MERKFRLVRVHSEAHLCACHFSQLTRFEARLVGVSIIGKEMLICSEILVLIQTASERKASDGEGQR